MEAAQQFGRGTPAGNAIFRLYNKKNMDSTLDPDLLARVKKMRQEREAQEAAAEKPKVVPKSQAHVAVPKFGRRSQQLSAEQRALAKLEFAGHRKRLSDIKAEMSASEPTPAPLPTKPPITEADKDRLAQIFEHGEVLPPPTKLTVPDAARYQRPTTADVLDARFTEITALLEEKRALLDDIKRGVAGGRNPADRRQAEMLCTNEIAQLISEMKWIDSKLRVAE